MFQIKFIRAMFLVVTASVMLDVLVLLCVLVSVSLVLIGFLIGVSVSK